MHRCPVTIPGQGHCPEMLEDDKLMDPAHWRLVPKPMQQAVYRAYAHGEGIGSPQLLAAQQAAVRAANRRLEG
jgi:hypothetical protein